MHKVMCSRNAYKVTYMSTCTVLQRIACHYLMIIFNTNFQVNPDSLRPHVSDLLQALVCCFKDDSWPVRDGEFFFSYKKFVILLVPSHGWGIGPEINALHLSLFLATTATVAHIDNPSLAMFPLAFLVSFFHFVPRLMPHVGFGLVPYTEHDHEICH